MKKYRVGFTQGTFDMFHVGHLNLLENAKQYCDVLIVGVNSDELVQSFKGKTPIISAEERLRIVRAIRIVDNAEICHTLDKLKAWERFRFDVVFIGDDWKGSDRWNATEAALRDVGADVVYFPYTQGVSSSIIRKRIGE